MGRTSRNEEAVARCERRLHATRADLKRTAGGVEELLAGVRFLAALVARVHGDGADGEVLGAHQEPYENAEVESQGRVGAAEDGEGSAAASTTGVGELAEDGVVRIGADLEVRLCLGVGPGGSGCGRWGEELENAQGLIAVRE